jgi:hypothetical protein
MNIRHASSLLPLSLSDEQMQVVMLAAASLPTEKKDLFLQRLASLLRFHGGRRHGDTDVTIAVRLALAVLSTSRRRPDRRRRVDDPIGTSLVG